MAAVATVLAAVSCNKEINNIDPVLPETETVAYTAYVDGAETKTSLGEYDEVNDKTSAVWNADDAITVHNGTTGYTFTTAESGTSVKFVYEGNDFDPAEGVMAVYPAGEYVADVAAKVVTANIPTWQQAQIGTYFSGAAVAVAYSEDNTLKFKNAVALLKFTVNTDNVTHVYFEGKNQEPLVGNVELGLDGETVSVDFAGENGSEVELYAWHDDNNKYFVKGETYYIAVAPQTFADGVTVSFKINDGDKVVVKNTSKKVVTKANVILDLGALEYTAPVVSDAVWGVCGTFTGNWDIANNAHMTATGDGWYVLENVEIYKDDEFKFVTNDSWTMSLGAKDAVLVAEENTLYDLVDNGQNIKVNKNGLFTLSLNPSSKKFSVECVKEYSDLVVNMTVQNNAGWSPLYVYMEVNGEAITPAEGELVTDNKFTVSGDYLGSSIDYYFISGTKKTEMASVTVTRNGATLLLEEKVINLIFKLDTNNAKQWWGTTAKIHVWNTGTSFDTTWPGNNMIYDENYTWHIAVPAELVGKSINYLIHNGNGWQSKDSKITISASGNTVTGSSIGIN